MLLPYFAPQPNAFASIRHSANSSHPSPDQIGASLDAALISTGAVPLPNEGGKCVVFRKIVELRLPPKHVKIDLFANSRYMLWVNGNYVDRGPARFEPNAPEYDSLDLTSFFRSGRNAISIMVSGPLSNGKVAWRPLALTAEVSVDGATMHTDKTWMWSDQTRYREAVADWPNIYDIADARQEDGDWTQADYDDSKWNSSVAISPPTENLDVLAQVDGQQKSLSVHPIGLTEGKMSWWGSLTARRIPLLREVVVKPVWEGEFPKILRSGDSISFKFSHLVLAYTKLQLDADAGTEIELTYSPMTRYVCRAGLQEFMTSDTHSIFEGAIRVKSGRATLKKVELVERLYPFERVGNFHSSDPLLDRLWTTCVRGLEITSEDAYIDCTDRERVEWMDCDPARF